MDLEERTALEPRGKQIWKQGARRDDTRFSTDTQSAEKEAFIIW